jgi:superfamily II DNA or RNA helicase
MQQKLELLQEAKPHKLRDYQETVVYEWDKSIEDKIRKTLLVASTGSGKTQMASEIVHKAVEVFGWRVMFVVHRDVLVSQSWSTFKRHGLHCGFIKAGWEQDLDAPVQIASTQTLLRRSQWQDLDIDLFIWDEAHITSFSSSSDKIRELFPDAHHLGLTATPWRLSKKQGMGDRFDHLISAPMMSDLIKQGYLCRPVYYGLPEIDLSGVATVGGDYNEGQLALKCDRSEIINEIVDEWFRLTRDRRTIAFAVSIEHSDHIARTFNERGVKAVSITASTPIPVRKEYYAQLASGEIKVVSSVGVLSEGFDCPAVDCILMCRPTKSKAFHFQSIGRGLRIALGKINCIILDQSGNIRRHGFVESLTKRGIQLKKGKDKGPGEAYMKECGSRGTDIHGNDGCECLLYAFKMVCPECGYVFPAKEAIAHIGQLKLLMCDERLEQYEKYQEDLRDYFKRGEALIKVDEEYFAEHREWPDTDWSFAALFGDTPSLGDALKLKRYCDRLGNDEPMLNEFGWDWEERLTRIKAKAERSRNTPTKETRNPRSLYAVR